MKIPFIIPNYNQLTFLKNLINWIRWYYPNPVEYPIFIVDNNSNYPPLLEYYNLATTPTVIRNSENTFIPNLRKFIDEQIKGKYEYYVISDPDIMPHPATPKNFIEAFISVMNEHKLHRIGFGLITNDLPDYLHEKAMIVGNEQELKSTPVSTSFGIGYKAPIDTTFCLYSTKNRGWEAPMDGKDWGNCMRLFEAFHLGWYIDGNNLNEEQKHYFSTSKYRVPGEPSAGCNNNRPKEYQ